MGVIAMPKINDLIHNVPSNFESSVKEPKANDLSLIFVEDNKPCQGDVFVLFDDEDKCCRDDCEDPIRRLIKLIMLERFFKKLFRMLEEFFKHSCWWGFSDIACNNNSGLTTDPRRSPVSSTYEIEQRGDKIRYSETHINSDGTASGCGMWL